MAESPPHPGARPAALHFPFGAAREALGAMNALVGDLKACRDAHEEAVVPARVDFEGRTRDDFDTAFTDAMGALDDHIQTLEGERDALEDHIADAERAIEARQDSIDQWESDIDAWRAANPPVTVGGPV